MNVQAEKGMQSRGCAHIHHEYIPLPRQLRKLHTKNGSKKTTIEESHFAF